MQTDVAVRDSHTLETEPTASAAGSRIWWLVVLVAILGVALVVVESGLEGEPVPDYLWAPDGETSEAERAYAAMVGVPPESVQLDIAAVEELERRGVDLCPTTDVPSMPADLASSAPVECVAYDGHGGVGYGLVATVIAGAGVLIMMRWRNRCGLYLASIVALDAIGAVAGAYAFRALVIEPGSLPFGHVAGFIGGQTWIPMLVLLVPLLVLSIPTGRLLSRRWRVVMVAAGVSAVVLAVTQALHPFLVGPVLNPLAAPWSVSTANTVFDYGNLLWMVVMVAALASLAVRAGGWAWRRVRVAR